MKATAPGLRIVLVTVVIPLVLTAIALIVSFSLAAAAPASIPVHWNVQGDVDRYGSPYTYGVIIAVVCLPFIAIFGGAVVLLTHRRALTVMGKLLAVTDIWVVLLLGVALSGGLVDAQSATLGTIFLWLLVGVVVATAASVGAWFLLPPAARRTSGSAPAVAPIVLGEDERATWIRSTVAPAGVVWGLVAVTVVVAVVCVFAIVVTKGSIWPIAFIPVVVIALALSNLAWTVRIDGNGVRARSSLGIPTINVRLQNIVSADVLEVNAVTEYGGWGIRWGLNGRIGIIVRSGEALEVRRQKGLSLVITIDDADSAAALINALVARSAASTAGG
jgi:Protein of unknown function (DUF1648)